MRRGLTLTLMTVAIALVSVQAMALAPVISDIPSPIVGGAEPVTGGSKFVYIDAFDIAPLATDDSTAQANLLWSFSGSGLRYTINGIAPLNLTTDDPTSPSTSKLINKTVAGGEWNQDAKASTITIRNQSLSPLGTGTNTIPSVTGIVPAETQLVTFFCSDGNAYSSKTTYFYTDNGGNDRLSRVAWTSVKTDQMLGAPATLAWRFDTTPGQSLGTVTTQAATPQGGLCLVLPLAGDNLGSMITNLGYMPLAANKIYRIKLMMNSSQTVRDNAPIWDFLIENYDAATQQGANLYALDQFYYAAGGGANVVVSSTNGTEVTMYWAPAAVLTSNWTTTAFTSTLDAMNDASFRIRSFDLTTIGGGGSKSGTVCVTNVTIESIDKSSMADDGAPIVNLTSLTQATSTGSGNSNVTTLFGAGVAVTATFSGGTVTLTPRDGGGGADGRSIELAEVYSAADLSDGDINSILGSDTKTWADNFPVPWVTGKILKLEAGLSAPAAADAANPWDAITLGFQPISNEILGESYVTTARGCGSPQVGAAQPYIFLFNTNTASTDTRFRWLKWRVRFTNSPAANFPSNTTAHALNTGAVRLHSVKVSNVKFQ